MRIREIQSSVLVRPSCNNAFTEYRLLFVKLDISRDTNYVSSSSERYIYMLSHIFFDLQIL